MYDRTLHVWDRAWDRAWEAWYASTFDLHQTSAYIEGKYECKEASVDKKVSVAGEGGGGGWGECDHTHCPPTYA